MIVAASPVPRPASAGPAMPETLPVPKLPLPGPDHPGVALAKLPDPPAAGSPAAARDMSITRRLIEARTPTGDAWARALDRAGGRTVWRELGAHAKAEPAVVQALLGAAFAAAGVQAGVGKRQWDRPRPFRVDPTIRVVGRTPRDESYPSGHSASAYAAARVLAALDPALTDEAYSLAREVVMSRVYAGVHFASDVVAGARLGTQLGQSIVERHRAGVLPATMTA